MPIEKNNKRSARQFRAILALIGCALLVSCILWSGFGSRFDNSTTPRIALNSSFGDENASAPPKKLAKGDPQEFQNAADTPDPMPVATATGTHDVKIEVVFIGGEPLTDGRILVKVAPDGREVKSEYGGTPVTITDVPYGSGLTVVVGHYKVEYDDYPEFAFAAIDVDKAGKLRCEVPLANEPQSALAVDLSSFSPDQKLHVSVKVSGFGLFSKYCRGGETYQSPITRAGMTVQVIIDGDAKWRSGDIELVEGKRVMVRAVIEDPSSLRVTIHNSKGEPISGALITCENSAMLNYKKLLELPPGTTSSGQYALTDAKGAAKLADIRPGDYGFLVYAEGYKPQSVYGVFISGKETDLGVVQLVEGKWEPQK